MDYKHGNTNGLGPQVLQQPHSLGHILVDETPVASPR
jgi:hypothetical protein